MLAAIYKSSKKAGTYLYIEKRDDFSRVSEALMQTFGQAKFVMLINLAKHEALAGADIHNVKQKIIDQGFYLQIPPPVENMLENFRLTNGLDKYAD
jgi:uncharacterized protein YcgL (UPF0745 family)